MKYLFILTFVLGNLVFANQFEGVVKFNYDYTLNGKLHAKRHYKIKLSGSDDSLKGHYVEMNNSSIWEFKFYKSRDSTIMHAMQIDGTFYRTMSGHVIDDKIVGTWFSVGKKEGTILKGDFEILK